MADLWACGLDDFEAALNLLLVLCVIFTLDEDLDGRLATVLERFKI